MVSNLDHIRFVIDMRLDLTPMETRYTFSSPTMIETTQGSSATKLVSAHSYGANHLYFQRDDVHLFITPVVIFNQTESQRILTMACLENGSYKQHLMVTWKF